jgi:hypothetical protein
MNVTISFAAIKKTVAAFLHRFHVTIFVLVVFGGLALVVFMLNNVIVLSTDSAGYTPETPSAEFDQATIDRIEELQTRDQSNGGLQLPPGRTNPFVE